MIALHIINSALISILVGFLIFPFIINIINFFFPKNQISSSNLDEKDIACIITAYKNIDLALFAAESLLEQDYQNHHVYIVADECELKEDLLNHPKLTILFPPRKLGSKVRSIHFAIDSFI